jgi:hypothetical protein
MIFLDFYADFGGFWPFLGDLEPDLRPDLGRKLGGGSPTQNLYKSEVFDIKRGSYWQNDDEFMKLEAIFMQGSH